MTHEHAHLCSLQDPYKTKHLSQLILPHKIICGYDNGPSSFKYELVRKKAETELRLYGWRTEIIVCDTSRKQKSKDTMASRNWDKRYNVSPDE